MRITYIFICVTAVCFISASCKDNTSEPSETKTEYEVMDTIFVSGFVGDSIKLDISLPSGYEDNPEKMYPVVYLTDGYWRREEHNTVHRMSDNKEILEVIIVGIGYPNDYDFNNIRVRDLIINADKFFNCIKNEVIAYVEKNYRADSLNRTLWGSSYGGYFLVYSFTEHIKQGKLFKNYICASAALNPPYTHIDLLDNENELWESTKELPINLYITVGGLETSFFINSYNQIIEAIESHDYKNLNFEHEIIPGTDHYTVWKPTLLEGLKKFLKI